MADQDKASSFIELMLSLERFKTNKFLCDFTVKVGKKSLPAHRNILAASSKYFEALFLSNIKVVQDGFIDMKDVEPNAIELCIEFMYTGEAKITMTTIQDILHSSDLLQLSDLTDLCFEELEKNISPQNSLFVIYLAQMYNRYDVKKHAEITVINNFNAVISTPRLSSIFKSDFIRYMKASNACNQTKWKAVIEWMNGQEGNPDNLFLELLASIDIQNFPIQFTLEVVLREKLVTKNKTAEHSIIAELFSDVEKLKANLDISNCFILKQLTETHQLSNVTDVSKVVRNFIAQNFKTIVERKEFLDLGKQEFFTLIQSPELECSETDKYAASVRWVKRDPVHRKKTFPTLLKMIKLDEFSLNYLKENVRTTPLVSEFKECNDMLMNEVFSRVATAKAGNIPPTLISTKPMLTSVQEASASAVSAKHRANYRHARGRRVDRRNKTMPRTTTDTPADTPATTPATTGVTLVTAPATTGVTGSTTTYSNFVLNLPLWVKILLLEIACVLFLGIDSGLVTFLFIFLVCFLKDKQTFLNLPFWVKFPLLGIACVLLLGIECGIVTFIFILLVCFLKDKPTFLYLPLWVKLSLLGIACVLLMAIAIHNLVFILLVKFFIISWAVEVNYENS